MAKQKLRYKGKGFLKMTCKAYADRGHIFVMIPKELGKVLPKYFYIDIEVGSIQPRDPEPYRLHGNESATLRAFKEKIRSVMEEKGGKSDG